MAAFTVDVLIGSPREEFWQMIQIILKGYYPYKMQRFKTIEDILENPDTSFKPILALIDGQDGTNAARVVSGHAHDFFGLRHSGFACGPGAD